MNPTHPAHSERLIVVVDDNQDATRLLSRLLQLNGYSVQACHTGQAGFEAAERLRPAAMILDLAMPVLDGYAVCELIRAQPWGKAMLLIALSGFYSEAGRQRSRDVGFDVHLSKPVNFTVLTDLLNGRLTAT